MKKILSEDRIDYQNYRFGYCVNIILEEDDSIEKAFERGYLPYTCLLYTSDAADE